MNGDVRYHKNGCEASYGNKTLSIETALGSLVVYANSTGVYDEFCIDLIGRDGRILPVAVVGVAEPNDFSDEPELHVYAWNGKDEDVADSTVLTVNENSCWFE